jgi:hypothetical protein
VTSALIALITALISGSGAAVAVRALADRRITAATAADQLTDSALEMVQSARREAHEARTEAGEARREANEARREAVSARIEAMNAAADTRRLVMAILDPYATLEALRKIVTLHPLQ